MKKIIAILTLLLTPLIFAQNTDKADRLLSPQEMQYNSFETTKQAFRTAVVGMAISTTVDTLEYGDTLHYFNPAGLYDEFVVTFKDTGSVLIDSMEVYTYVQSDTTGMADGDWSPIGAWAFSDKTFDQYYIPGAGNQRTYRLFLGRHQWVKVIRTNVAVTARKTPFIVEMK